MKPTTKLPKSQRELDQEVKSNDACRPGNLLVMTGPSGVGKGTIVERVLQQVIDLKRSVSVTTRERRPGETEGVDYFFVSESEFERMRDNQELMEWAEFAGAYYGTPRIWVDEELKAGRHVLLEIEVQGAKQIAERFAAAVLVFISPPNLEALEQRLLGRATETPEKIAMRLKKARQELKQKALFHYEVVNDNIDLAVDNLVHIIYAERCRIRERR